MRVTDRRMWIAAVACCAALIGLALAPWLEGGEGGFYEFQGTQIPLVLGISRGELLIPGAIAMAAISLFAICRPDIEQHLLLILPVVALGAFILCAWTMSADWWVGCGALQGDMGGSICLSGGVDLAPTLSLGSGRAVRIPDALVLHILAPPSKITNEGRGSQRMGVTSKVAPLLVAAS